MKWFRVILSIGFIIGLLVFTAPDSASANVNVDFSAEYIMVKFKGGADFFTIQDVLLRHGDTVEFDIPGIGVRVFRVPAGKMVEKILAYSKEKCVEFVEPDYIASVAEVYIPDDQYLNEQWGMDIVKATQAWDITTGQSEVSIAILDTGVDQNHEDLADKIIANENFTWSNTVDDLYGHGTHVAGIAAAITNNGIGMAGMGYNSTIMNVKVLGDNGRGNYSWIANGIIWAVDHGAKVINMSLSGNSPSLTLESAINYAWNKGAVLVSAAGNNSNTLPTYPAYYTNVLSVAAIDHNDEKPSFSSYGTWVDIAAPGVNILSTLPNHPNQFAENYGYLDGTSMATPFTSGLAALLWATPYGTDNVAVVERIQSTADMISGTGIYWQYGRINAFKATNIPPSSTTNEATNVSSFSAQLNGNVESLGTASTVSVSFQWGLNPEDINLETPTQILDSATLFHYKLSDLSANTTYYYQAKVVGDDITIGEVMSFTTSPFGWLRVQTVPAVPTTIFIDGKPCDGWGLNWVKLPAGVHTLSLSDVRGFATPTQISISQNAAPPVMQSLTIPITIVDGQITEVTANFTELGNLHVTTDQPVPATIFVDGNPMDDWGFWTYLLPGTYTVSFESLDGYIGPGPQVVTINTGATTSLVGTYAPGANTVTPTPRGFLRVQTIPAVPSEIMVEGITRDSWGLNWVKLPPGSYTISLSDVSGFATPAHISVSQNGGAPVLQLLTDPITIVDGQITEVTANFTELGNLHVTTDQPVPATIFVDGNPMDDWGFWTYLLPGTYTVSFQTISGMMTPAPIVVNVTSGVTTAVVGYYYNDIIQLVPI
jgi:thermitase